ncbi:acyltransferase family protein [Hyphomicrobium sp. ghe19]|uniref:acyltransferase family protein n=1 Tax=Hyphomicrobium sp. ghe19 TaxID=2682968 RepID=UPI001366F4B9|nr:hypothetical protein HYPP_02806 [Hyphomicrobium sp. ghe19]
MRIFEHATIAISAKEADLRRDVHVQTLRGIACLLIVAYHVTGTDGTHGVEIAADHPLAIFNLLLAPVRLPLFTFISGYVYAMRPVRVGGGSQFLFGKARRLLVPLVVVGGLYFLIQDHVPGTHYFLPLHDVWQIAMFPYQHLWYLQALMLIFTTTVVLESLRQMENLRSWLLVLAASILIYVSIKFPIDLVAINEALFLLPFFTLGLGVRRFHETLTTPPLGAVSAFFALLGIFAYFLMIMRSVAFTELDQDLLRIVIGMPACVALFCFQVECFPIAWIGEFSYAIYLFHILGTAGARIFLMRCGVTDTSHLIIASFLAGLSLPILIQIFADRSKVASFLLLGRNPKRARVQTSLPILAP